MIETICLGVEQGKNVFTEYQEGLLNRIMQSLCDFFDEICDECFLICIIKQLL